MKKPLTILFLVLFHLGYGQTQEPINSFKLIESNDITISTIYFTNDDETTQLQFNWDVIDMNIKISKKLFKEITNTDYNDIVKVLNNNEEKHFKDSIIKKHYNKFRFKIKEDKAYNEKVEIDIMDFTENQESSTNEENSIDIKYKVHQKVTFNGKLDTIAYKYIYNLLKRELSKDGKIIINKVNFIDLIQDKIKKLKKSIFNKHTNINPFYDKQIIPKKEDDVTLSENPWYFEDIRNPIAFSDFIIRNPRSNGTNTLSNSQNSASYHYIKPGSIINILFNKEIYYKLNNPKIAISAYLKRKNGNIVPITVSGYYVVKTKSNKLEYENNLIHQLAKKNIKKINEILLEYNYSISSQANSPIQAEINTSNVNPQPEDVLIVTISNVSDGNVSFTTTFEYENFGWETYLSGGFAWVNTINNEGINYRVAGTSSNMFHYKYNKGDKFWKMFLSPSFGPELVVLQDTNQTTVGLGLSVSTFLRTLKVGYGWNLTGENHKPYFLVGVNFVEGYKSISSILGRSKE